jgi:hypothetical protein
LSSVTMAGALVGVLETLLARAFRADVNSASSSWLCAIFSAFRAASSISLAVKPSALPLPFDGRFASSSGVGPPVVLGNVPGSARASRTSRAWWHGERGVSSPKNDLLTEHSLDE